MAFNDARIAIDLPDIPRADDAGIHPGGSEGFSAATVLHGVGRVVGIGAERTLGLLDVVQPLGEERGDIGVDRGRTHVNLGVAHPAHALVPLRTIGWHLHEVGPLRPHDIPEELVDHRIGTFEMAGQRRVIVEDEAGDGIERRPVCQAGYLDELESVIGETGNPFLSVGVPLEDVLVGCPRSAQVLGHQAAIGVEHLAVPQRDRRAGRTSRSQADYPGEVLTEIEDVDAGLPLRDLSGGKLFRNHNGGSGVGLEQGGSCEAKIDKTLASSVEIGRWSTAVLFRQDRVLPLLIVEPRRGPARHLPTRVVGFPALDIRLPDGTIAGNGP